MGLGWWGSGGRARPRHGACAHACVLSVVVGLASGGHFPVKRRQVGFLLRRRRRDLHLIHLMRTKKMRQTKKTPIMRSNSAKPFLSFLWSCELRHAWRGPAWVRGCVAVDHTESALSRHSSKRTAGTTLASAAEACSGPQRPSTSAGVHTGHVRKGAICWRAELKGTRGKHRNNSSPKRRAPRRMYELNVCVHCYVHTDLGLHRVFQLGFVRVRPALRIPFID